MKTLPCIRCGRCCQMGPCEHGQEGDDGTDKCAYLEGENHCGIYNKIKDDPMFGSGCHLRTWEKYLEP